MLTVNNLCVSYGKQHTVLDKLNLELQADKVHGIVGLNGSGKTTLFNTFYGFVKPQSGELLYRGELLCRTKIAYLEAENYFYSGITGKEYLRLFCGKKSSISSIHSWQSLLELPLEKLIDSYSTGMKKKLALAATLLLDKEVVILDEPFNGLDIETSYVVKMLIKKLREQGKTVLVSSHILETLTSVCDFIHYLANKHIEASYSKNDFVSLQGKIEGTIECKAGRYIDTVL